MDEQLAVLEVGSLDEQPGVSVRVQRGVPDFRPESVPEGVLRLDRLQSRRDRGCPASHVFPRRRAPHWRAMDEVEDLL
jgi:hypothetical protein